VKKIVKTQCANTHRIKAVAVPSCDICGRVQSVLGAIEYGPPIRFPGKQGYWCRKWHVCKLCYLKRHKTKNQVVLT